MLGWLRALRALEYAVIETLVPESTDPASTCTKCHFGIVSEYSKTAMAHASRSALERPMDGRRLHQQSKVEDQVYQDVGKLWLDFGGFDGKSLRGGRELLYLIGSGNLKGAPICSKWMFPSSNRRFTGTRSSGSGI